MSEQRFERWNDHSCKVKDNQEDTFLKWEDVVHKLNEQQATIKELERKLKKYSKIGEEQLKQIIELQEQLQDYHEIKDNWDSMVAMATTITKRNVILDEKIGKIQRENERLRKELKVVKNDK